LKGVLTFWGLLVAATNYQYLTTISDWAYAPDGGSMWICLDGPSEKAGFTLVRSFASHGEGTFGKVIGKDGTALSDTDVAALREHLKTLARHSEDRSQFVASFISVLEVD
jgi:hypothetical protein